MAAEDDLVTRWVFEDQGSTAIDLVNQHLDANRKQIEYVQAAMQSANAPTAAYKARLDDLVQTNQRLTQEVERLRIAETAHVQAMYDETAAAVREAAAFDRLVDEAYRAAAAKDKLATSTTAVHTGMVQVQSGSSKAAQGLLQLGYMADDMQYGFRGIANNIPMLALSLGGPNAMAIAGASAIAATAVNQLIIHWSDLTALFSSSAGSIVLTSQSIAALKAHIEALTKNPYKLELDYSRLDEAKKHLAELEANLQAFEAAAKARTTTQEAAAKVVKEAVVEYGGGTDEKGGAPRIQEIIRGIRERNKTLYQGQGPALTQAADLERSIAVGEQQLKLTPREDVINIANIRSAIAKDRQKLIDLKAEMDKQANTNIQTMVGAALRGEEDARAKVEQLYMENREAFRKGGVGEEFGAGIVMASRENVLAQEQNKLAVKRAEDEAKQRKADEADLDADIAATAERDRANLEAWNKAKARRKRLGLTPEQQAAATIKEDEAERKFNEQFQKQVGQAPAMPAAPQMPAVPQIPAMPFAFGPGMPTDGMGGGIGAGMGVGPAVPAMGGMMPAMPMVPRPAGPRLTAAQRRTGAMLAAQARKTARQEALARQKFARKLRWKGPVIPPSTRPLGPEALAALGPAARTARRSRLAEKAAQAARVAAARRARLAEEKVRAGQAAAAIRAGRAAAAAQAARAAETLRARGILPGRAAAGGPVAPRGPVIGAAGPPRGWRPQMSADEAQAAGLAQQVGRPLNQGLDNQQRTLNLMGMFAAQFGPYGVRQAQMAQQLDRLEQFSRGMVVRRGHF